MSELAGAVVAACFLRVLLSSMVDIVECEKRCNSSGYPLGL